MTIRQIGWREGTLKVVDRPGERQLSHGKAHRSSLDMTSLTKPPKERQQEKPAIRRIVEFQGIRKLSLPQYRTHIRQLYDGPAGAVLALGSMISLHEPLVGHILRSRKFDVSAIEPFSTSARRRTDPRPFVEGSRPMRCSSPATFRCRCSAARACD